MTEWLRRGLEGSSVRSTLYLYVSGLLVLAPIALATAAMFGSQIAFEVTPILAIILALGEYCALGVRGAHHGLLARAMDVAIAASVFCLVAPLMVLITIALKLESPNAPALFMQSRVGCGGKHFTLLKFRTLTFRDLLPVETELGGMTGGLPFKVRDDPRLTRVGRVLREFGLDELPEVINVLRGDMAIVGPTAPWIFEVEAGIADAPSGKPGVIPTWGVLQLLVRGRGDDVFGLKLGYAEYVEMLNRFAALFRSMEQSRARMQGP